VKSGIFFRSKYFRYLWPLIISAFLAVVLQAQTQEKSDKASLEELRAKAAEVMALRDFVAARGRIREVWNLVDRLDQLGKTKEMSKYLEFGLLHDPWALKYQLRYAKILQSKGEKEKASEKANVVANYAETEELLNGALALLHKDTIREIPAISTFPTDGYSLVIVPIGEVDAWLLWRLQVPLQDILGIPVYVKDASIPLSKCKRNRLKLFIRMNREFLIAKIDTPEIKEILAALHLDKAALENDEAVIKVAREFMKKKGGDNAVQKFEQFLKDAEQLDKQWEIHDLLNNMQKAIHPYRKSRIGFLGITGVDCFWNDNNYIFGVAKINRRYGVMSYRRFMADFNGEPPNSDRLFQRSLKQALSTTGLMYGLPRCTNPTCVRAYPNNLAEHDAKSAALCQTCKEGFQKIFHAKKKEPNTF